MPNQQHSSTTKPIEALSVVAGSPRPLFSASGRVVCHFSCGAASAVATKLAIEKYGEVEIIYCDTGSEHNDNTRFIRDCERWFGRTVTVVRSSIYSDIWDLFTRRHFIIGAGRAICTGEMKRIPGDATWQIGDTDIYGYTADESNRLDRWRAANNERIIECPLIDAGLTKADCLRRLAEAGIEIPAMYRLGFRNNNCIGCVKARDSMDYWKRVRKHFPEHFARMAKIERELNTTINRRTRNGVRTPIFLDEIEPGDPKGADPQIACGILCMVEADGNQANAADEQRRGHDNAN